MTPFILFVNLKKYCFYFLLFLFFIPISYSQDTNQIQDVKILKNISLSASKFPIHQYKTPQNITIIGENILANSQGNEISNILNTHVSGIQIIGTGSNYTAIKSLKLRGTNNSQTLILIDGIPVYDPTGIGSAFELRLLSPNSFSQIEVLKGSQSTLYGSDAMAGIVNLISKEKENTSFNVDLSFASGNYGNRETSASIGFPFFGKTTMQISFTNNLANGISEAKDTTQRKTFDKDGINHSQFYSNIFIPIHKNISFKPFIRFNTMLSDYDVSAFTDAKKNNYSINILQAGYIFKVKKNLQHRFSYQRTNRIFDDNSPFTPDNYLGKTLWTNLSFKQNIFKGLYFIYDMEYRRHSYNDLEFLQFDTNSNISGAIDSSYFLQQFSGSFNATINIKDKVFIDLGGRLMLSQEFGSKFTYATKAMYQPHKALSLFAGISSAYKTPSLYQLYSQYGNRKLKPEEATTTEVGVKGRLADKLSYSLVYFNYNATNLVSYINFAYKNFEKQNNYGVELEWKYNLLENLSLQGNYTFVDGELQTETSINNKDTSYNNLYKIGSHKASLSSTYSLKDFLFFSADVTFVSGRKDLAFDASFRSFSVNLKPYVLLNAYAKAIVYETNKYQVVLFGRVKNITNTDYQESYGYSTLGINFMLGIQLSYNK